MKKVFSILLLVSGACAVALPVAAKTEKKAEAVSTDIHTFDEQMIEAGRIAESNARMRSHRRCWRAVKNAMVEANVLDDRPTTRYAKQAGEELEEKYGFKKIDVSDPFDAPIGAVLVYGGHGAGHVEIRVPDGFVSDVVNTHPSHRPLLGVYVRV
jgi:hypothetical protein